ncbi:MAG: glycoside hydrolase family 25 protein [Lachnospiraceae bacterium]|nr:glycoside hydrolase family 25 protein [Lachnospiraceae bacterium]
MNSERSRGARPEQAQARRGARRAGGLIAIIFLSLISMVALTFCVFLLLRIEVLQDDERHLKESVERLNAIEEEGYVTEAEALSLIEEARSKSEQEATGKILDWIRTQLTEGSTSIWMLRNLYSTFSREVIVASNGTFYFFDLNDEYHQALVSPAELKPASDGRMRYLGADPAISGAFGIDVSRFQGKIDWKKVAADGVKFAFIRVGARGSSEGKFIEDAQFEANIEGALKEGIQVGVYFYTQAISEEEAVEEAEFVLKAIEPYEVALPVVFDIEPTDSPEARTSKLTAKENTDIVLAFCNRVSEAGYQPMLYGGLRSLFIMLEMDRLEHLKKWFAFYDNTQYYPYEYSYWQYSDSGRVDGIEGDVDLNICIEDLARP